MAQSADPDLVLSDWGDDAIIPTALALEPGVWRAPAPGPRDGPGGSRFTGGRSYSSYARIVYHGSSPPLTAAGTWTGATLHYREAGLTGLIQITRIGQMPLQRAAGSTPRPSSPPCNWPGPWPTAS